MIIIEREIEKAKKAIVEVLNCCKKMHEEHDLLDKNILRTKPIIVRNLEDEETGTIKIQVKLSQSLDEQTTEFIRKRMSTYVALYVEIVS